MRLLMHPLLNLLMLVQYQKTKAAQPTTTIDRETTYLAPSAKRMSRSPSSIIVITPGVLKEPCLVFEENSFMQAPSQGAY